MKIFQNSGVHMSYMDRLNTLSSHASKFSERLDIFLNDRYGACHILEPIHSADPDAFFTNGDDIALQKMWASEHGMPAESTPAEVLLAQIESHGTEIFYNTDPIRFGSDFVARLPASVKRTVCWRAAPSGDTDLSGYSRVVNNFPSILNVYRETGLDARYFFPAHDPVLDSFASRTDRPIDVLFIGGYSQHHQKRAEVLAAVAGLNDRYRIAFCLQRSRLTKLAESLPGHLLPLGKHRRPTEIRAVSAPPVYGRDLYQMLSQAKIVLNGAIDMAGNDRGNIRCFESLGAGCAMVSDVGQYPKYFADGQTHLGYTDADDARHQIISLLNDSSHRYKIAAAGHAMLASQYTLRAQWQTFVQICE